MDTRQLEVFITAAQYLNFTEASKQHNIVPSAVSHNISMLEKELGEKLFVRMNNRISLTPFGETFLEEAIKINTIANNVIAKKISEEKRIEETLRVGFVFPEFILKFEPVFSKCYEDNPGMAIRFRQYDSISLAKKLSEMELDVAFGRELTFGSYSHIKWQSLYKDPFVILVKNDHPLAKKKKITVPMLKGETVIAMNRSSNPGMFDMITHLFQSNNITPFLNDHSNHHLTTIMLASMGRGIVIIPNLNICYAKLPENLVIKKLDDPLGFHEIGIAWNGRSEKPIVQKFVKKIADSQIR